VSGTSGWSDEFPRAFPLAESGLLVTFGDDLSVPLSRRIAALTETLLALDHPGIVDLVPSYTTLTVLLDPEHADVDAIATVVRERWVAGSADTELPAARQVTIPVTYGGEDGPDLAAVASHTGLSADDVVRRHTAAGYLVAALGFAPGFAFLIGLPPELAVPRRAEPRTRVPPGSVGIGGAQTGVYALPTPGGWNLIGRTPRRLFDPAAAARGSDPFTLHVGDEVRFEAVAAEIVPSVDATDDTPAPGAESAANS
jgi:KipI family sensor histidine kinase inhibitor